MEMNLVKIPKPTKKYFFNFCVIYKSCCYYCSSLCKPGVHTIKFGNRELFWVKMIDVQKGLGLKNMPNLVKQEICGIFENCRGVKKCNDGINRLKKKNKEKILDLF